MSYLTFFNTKITVLNAIKRNLESPKNIPIIIVQINSNQTRVLDFEKKILID